jgi:hypothetical protein
VPQKLVFKYPYKKISRGLMSGEHEGQESEDSRPLPTFRTATDALHGCSVVEQRRVETKVKMLVEGRIFQ